MKFILHRATVCDIQSDHHSKVCDIYIRNGVIEKVTAASRSLPRISGYKTIDCKNQLVSPGFCDMRASLGEPGFEHKETLQTAARAAQAGGYTTVVCLPNTTPVIQSKSDIEFISSRSAQLPVHILPAGALTHNREGTDMNELYDMHTAGAVAFTDGNKPIMNSGLLQRALEYARHFNGLIYIHAHDLSLSPQYGVSEGEAAMWLGMKGVPWLAESTMIMRDIELAAYANHRIHFSHISSKQSVNLIRKARKAGAHVTCDVSVAHLCFTDAALSEYDTLYKLNPPLRTESDRKALWEGLADGTIDAIVTDHNPQNTENKQVEFEYAADGMIQLQTAYSLLCMHAPKYVPVEVLVQKLTAQPRAILVLPDVKIGAGSPAELVIHNPTDKWNYHEKNNASLSKNSPVLGQTLTGKIMATLTNDQLHLT
ncbi:MAG: dihydroorotase [Bacteroidota bacterium]